MKKNAFKQVSEIEKERLLKKYWSIPARQVETSVVLADQKWFDLQKAGKEQFPEPSFPA